jgi:hypothetical protein
MWIIVWYYNLVEAFVDRMPAYGPTMNNRSLVFLLLLCASGDLQGAPPDFDKQVAPILAARCMDCHTGAKPKGAFDVTIRANVLEGKTPNVVSGKPGDSPLWQRIAADEMPPKKSLPEAERKIIKEWIESGAKWGTDPLDPFRLTTASRAGYDWWALQPLTPPSPPQLDKGVATNPIDQFIAARLREKGFPQSPQADRRVLIRRLYLDLVGLPPTPEEVTEFVNDFAPNAYEKLVDRLLASPHYGERWARHWLDIVRYGETDGFERNTPRPTAWHYRDWLIRAINSDLPYDEFVRLQLAGDVLRPNDPDALKATGFLVAGVHNTVLGNDEMRAVARQDELEDVVGAVGQTFLGLTVNCARCHDHKFDPISQADFYRLASALSGVGFGERPIPEVQKQAEIARLSKQLTDVTSELARLEDPARKTALAGKGTKPGVIFPPAPVAAWDFRMSGNDLVGKLHAKPAGEVKSTTEGVRFDGKTGFLRTSTLGFDLRAKTLEAWVRLDSLTQRGGGVISIQTPEGNEFDAIVFGEREPGRWMAGSDFFRRTSSFGAGEDLEGDKQLVHLAITYSPDGVITGYRNGKPHGKSYKSNGPLTYKAGSAVVIFGCRHEPAGGNKMLAGTISVARLYDVALSPAQVDASHVGMSFITETELIAQLTAEQQTTRMVLRKKQDALTAELARLREQTHTAAYVVLPQPPGITRLLVRGQVTQPAGTVPPGGLSAIRISTSDFRLPVDASDLIRREKLAEWITDPKNPLFSRVMVNRIWHYHFGIGIVETPSDFGFNGSRPSHPELLDWLASEFVARKYSLKALHRIIVTCATYRQSSAPRKECLGIDATNRLLWRFSPRRLEGEAVRDFMLSVSGLLNPQVGGKGFSDYKEQNFNGTAYFEPFDPIGPEFHRRSIYRFTPRGANVGLLDVFDCPDPAAAAPRRAVTTTPLQALTLWNNGFALRAADAFAARVAKEATGIDKQVARAWQLAYHRQPTPEESGLAVKLASHHGLKALCRVLFNSNEFVTIE